MEHESFELLFSSYLLQWVRAPEEQRFERSFGPLVSVTTIRTFQILDLGRWTKHGRIDCAQYSAQAVRHSHWCNAGAWTDCRTCEMYLSGRTYHLGSNRLLSVFHLFLSGPNAQVYFAFIRKSTRLLWQMEKLATTHTVKIQNTSRHQTSG